MKKLIEDDFDNILLVSWDGDYKMMVDYIVERNKFTKVLAPNLKYASSLYKHGKNLEDKYFDHLDKKEIKNKLQHRKKAP